VQISGMKQLSCQTVVSVETQVGNTSQRNKWANMDPRRSDQVHRRRKHPLPTGHTDQSHPP
jgi:hypothetical protein